MSIRKYIRIPVEVEAVQWLGDNAREVMDFVGDFGVIERGCVELCTTKGMRTARVKSWIIRENWNNYYVCSPAIFEKAYRDAEDYEYSPQQSNPSSLSSEGFEERKRRMFEEEDDTPAKKESPSEWADRVVESSSK